MSTSGKPGHTGMTRVIKAAGYSVKGLKATFRNEAAFRQELALFFAGSIVLLVLSLPVLESLLMWLSLVLVLIVELLNSAVEAVVDRIGTDYHYLSGQAKDIGSAAVLISLLAAGIIWVTILFNHYV